MTEHDQKHKHINNKWNIEEKVSKESLEKCPRTYWRARQRTFWRMHWRTWDQVGRGHRWSNPISGDSAHWSHGFNHLFTCSRPLLKLIRSNPRSVVVLRSSRCDRRLDRRPLDSTRPFQPGVFSNAPWYNHQPLNTCGLGHTTVTVTTAVMRLERHEHWACDQKHPLALPPGVWFLHPSTWSVTSGGSRWMKRSGAMFLYSCIFFCDCCLGLAVFEGVKGQTQWHSSEDFLLLEAQCADLVSKVPLSPLVPLVPVGPLVPLVTLGLLVPLVPLVPLIPLDPLVPLVSLGLWFHWFLRFLWTQMFHKGLMM